MSEREPQEPVKIVLQDIQTKQLSNGYNAIIKGTGDMTKGKEYFTKWFVSEFEANKALEILAERQGCIVSIDKWHTKGGYQNWEEYTLLEDEPPPAPLTDEEKIQDAKDSIAHYGEIARECMAQAKTEFGIIYPDLTGAIKDPQLLSAILEIQQKWGIALFIKVA